MVWCSPSRSRMLAMVEMEKKCMPRVYELEKIVIELNECFDTDTNHLGHLKKFKQSDIVEDFIATFE
jgi:hypothetical protein